MKHKPTKNVKSGDGSQARHALGLVTTDCFFFRAGMRRGRGGLVFFKEMNDWDRGHPSFFFLLPFFIGRVTRLPEQSPSTAPFPSEIPLAKRFTSFLSHWGALQPLKHPLTSSATRTNKKMHLTYLTRDVLHEICHFIGPDVALLLFTGDKSLERKLKSLRSLSVELGRKGGYVSFVPLYSLLTPFSALESLDISSFDGAQLWQKKLLVGKLPSTLRHLKLHFWDAIQTHAVHHPLFHTLPNLTSLDLREKVNPGEPKSSSNRLLLDFIPSTICELRLSGVMSIPHTELDKLPSHLKVLLLDGLKVTNGDYTQPMAFLDFRRFTSLNTLKIKLDHATTTSEYAFPSTITYLDLAFRPGLVTPPVFRPSDFPTLKSLYWTLSERITWETIMELPFTTREIMVTLEPFELLPEAERLNIITMLTSRNDNWAAFGGHQDYLVPSRVSRLRLPSTDLPPSLLALFSGLESCTTGNRIRTTIPIEYMVTVFSLPNLRTLSYSPTTPIKGATAWDFPLNPATGRPINFSKLLVKFHFKPASPLTSRDIQSLPEVLRNTLYSFSGLPSPDIGPQGLRIFPSLRVVKWTHTQGIISVSHIEAVLPDTVTDLTISTKKLQFDVPIRIPSLKHLKIVTEIEPEHLSMISAPLTSLKVTLREPFDLSNPDHRIALLSFPRGLRYLTIEKGISFYSPFRPKCIKLSELGVVVNSRYRSVQPTRSQLLADENEAFELLVRNLKLIKLKVPAVQLMRDRPMTFLEELPDAFHNWASMRIPFYQLIFRDPVLAGPRLHAPVSSSVVNKRVIALAHADFSVVDNGGDSMHGDKKFTELYLESKGIILAKYEEIDRRDQKRAIAVEVFHSLAFISVYDVAFLTVYAARWYLGYDSLLKRLWNANLSTGLSVSLISDYYSSSSWLALSLFVLTDMKVLSALLGLPFALKRIYARLKAKPDIMSYIPHFKATMLHIILAVIFSWSFTPLPIVGPLIAEWTLFWESYTPRVKSTRSRM